MKPILFALTLFLVAACKEELAERPGPVPLTAEAVGYYCQMNLLEHEGPKGQIHLDGMPAPIFFSQVRDTLTYLNMPEQNYAVRATYVQDMAHADSWASPGAWIVAEEALYVVGSDRKGGMGAPEFVPFSDAASAQTFATQHGGSVRRFDQIGAADLAPPEASHPPHDDDIAARLKALDGNPEGN